jgi:hypothetical protein
VPVERPSRWKPRRHRILCATLQRVHAQLSAFALLPLQHVLHEANPKGIAPPASSALIISALISALLGGVVVAIVTYYLNRDKTRAEIAKLIAETEKTRAEIRGLSATVNYAIAEPNEQIIFDGQQSVDGFAIKPKEGRFWFGPGKPRGDKGEGSVKFESGGILNVHRTNTVGRFELLIQQYTYGGRQHSVLPSNALIAGNRKLRITCEAKVIGSAHTLRFVVRTHQDGTRLAEEVQRITLNEWTPVQVYLQALATEDSEVRIDDEQVSASPSSIQIRNLVVAERNN